MGWSLIEVLNDNKAHMMIDFPFAIGRSMQANICLRNVYISKQHAVITHRDNGLFIFDSSINGTFLNSVRLKRGRLYAIKENDIISLCFDEERCKKERGKNCFIFRLEAEEYVFDTSSSSNEEEVSLTFSDSVCSAFETDGQVHKDVAAVLESVVHDVCDSVDVNISSSVHVL